MAQHACLGFLVLLTCCLFETQSRPSSNETEPVVVSLPSVNVQEKTDDRVSKERTEDCEDGRSQSEDAQKYSEDEKVNTRDILQKIKTINDGLKKPSRHKFNYYKTQQSQPGGSFSLDAETLKKIQQIIAAGKLNGMTGNKKQQESNHILNEELSDRVDYTRALQYLQPTTNLANNQLGNANNQLGNGFSQIQQNQQLMASYNSPGSMPYLTSIPVLVVPTPSNGYYGSATDKNINSLQAYQTRQRPSFPSFPFQFQWPLAQFFPVLIRDPLVHYVSTGGFDNLFEFGQSADVCSRKQKSSTDEISIQENELQNVITQLSEPLKLTPKSRKARSVKYQEKAVKHDKNTKRQKIVPKQKIVRKRTISKVAEQQELSDSNKIKALFSRPTSTTTIKPPNRKIISSYLKNENEHEGDLRFPFSEFGFGGNKKPVAPSPGFFINRLKVRRGGVAIAGPGGVATAGRGGTAIVGAGGLGITQPGGLAVAGPAARIVALSPDADLSSIVTRLQHISTNNSSVARFLQAIPEGKVVAIGPVIYFHPLKPL